MSFYETRVGNGGISMALAIVVLSTERGRNTATILAPSWAEWEEARAAVDSPDLAAYYARVGTASAGDLMARAFERAQEHAARMEQEQGAPVAGGVQQLKRTAGKKESAA